MNAATPKPFELAHNRRVRYCRALCFEVPQMLANSLTLVEIAWQESPWPATRRHRFQDALGFPIPNDLLRRLEQRERIEGYKGDACKSPY